MQRCSRVPGRIRHDETAWAQLSVGLHCCRYLEEPLTSKLEELDQCDFPNGKLYQRGGRLLVLLPATNQALEGSPESCRVSVTSVPAGVCISSKHMGSWERASRHGWQRGKASLASILGL